MKRTTKSDIKNTEERNFEIFALHRKLDGTSEVYIISCRSLEDVHKALLDNHTETNDYMSDLMFGYFDKKNNSVFWDELQDKCYQKAFNIPDSTTYYPYMIRKQLWFAC